jgi:hypothetical protein
MHNRFLFTTTNSVKKQFILGIQTNMCTNFKLENYFVRSGENFQYKDTLLLQMILLFGEDIPYSSQVQESYNEYL